MWFFACSGSSNRFVFVFVCFLFFFLLCSMLCFKPCNWCIKLICRLWPLECAGTSHWGRQVAFSASELPLWGSKTPRVVLLESTVLIYSHKGSKVTRFITYKFQKTGGWGALSWGKGSPLSRSQAGAREQVVSTYYLEGCWGRGHLNFHRLNSKWLF